MAVEKWSTFVQNFVNIAIGYYFNDDSYIQYLYTVVGLSDLKGVSPLVQL